MAKAPLELSRKPVLALEGGCVIDTAVYMKKVRKITDASKLAPMTFLTFFSLLRKPGRLCRPDCRSGTTCVWDRRFFCGKNEREEAPLRRRDSETRSFRRSETARPAGATAQAGGRPDDAVVRIREADRKRACKSSGRACPQP